MRLLWITAALVAFATFVFSVFVEMLGFSVVENPGIAFGILIPEPFQRILIVVALIVVVWIACDARNRWEACGFGCIIGGAGANILDRVIDGTVTDVFRVGNFPLFNAADVAITIGVVMVCVVQGRGFWEKVFTK